MAIQAKAASALRAALDATFAALPARLAQPGTGVATARAISDIYDREIAARFTVAAADIAAPLALVATGGWARRELAPFSDLDLIVLHDGNEIAAKQLSDRLLYPLWDDRLAIGHSAREPRAVALLAKDDLATATALVDARFIAGDRDLFSELERATRELDPSDLITRLAAENRARHVRFGAAIYVLEPNLKQGIGALRDLSTALWAARVRWLPTPENVIAELLALGHLTLRQAAVLEAALDFQLRLRALVQLSAKRRFDQLTFEIQEAIAPALYPNVASSRAAVAPAVEALMRDYYLHARGVLQVSERLLEAARVPANHEPLVTRLDDAYVTINGELAVEHPQRFVEQPAEMVRLFRIALAEDLPIHGHTQELVAEQLARDPRPLADDERAAPLLRDALIDLSDAAVPSRFEEMHQLGILAALMPGWAPCTARVQHDLYHVYTVDQHQLYALAMQKRLARGELATEHPLATELWKTIADPAPLLLATLLHDVGKPLGKGHAEKGAVIAGDVARRLGIADVDTVEFLVRQHLTMSHLSQRRDLSDPDVVARFADKAGSRLAELYLLTLCDTAMTAPDNLSAWKDDLLRELFLRARAVMRGEEAPDETTEPRAKILAQLVDEPAARAVVDTVDPRLLVQLTPRQVVRHARLATSTSSVALEVHCYPMKGHSEVAIVAPDKPGVLAAIASALGANRIDVLGAILGHSGAVVLDLFFVRDLKGAAIPEDDPRWSRLLDDLRQLVTTQGSAADLIKRRRPKSTLPARVTPSIATEIKIHDDSTQATIVEVATRDRPGVLFAITQTFAELGWDIQLAKIATEGEKVADVFYVTRAGERLTDAAERAHVIERLSSAVEDL